MSYLASLVRPPTSPVARRAVAASALEAQALEQVPVSRPVSAVADDRMAVHRVGLAPEPPSTMQALYQSVAEPPRATVERVELNLAEGEQAVAPRENRASTGEEIEGFEVSRFVVVEPVSASSFSDDASDSPMTPTQLPPLGRQGLSERGPINTMEATSLSASGRDIEAPAPIVMKVLADLRDEHRRKPDALVEEFGEQRREAPARTTPRLAPAEGEPVPSGERSTHPVQVHIGSIALTVKAAPAVPLAAPATVAERMTQPGRTPLEGFAFSACRHHLRWR